MRVVFGRCQVAHAPRPTGEGELHAEPRVAGPGALSPLWSQSGRKLLVDRRRPSLHRLAGLPRPLLHHGGHVASSAHRSADPGAVARRPLWTHSPQPLSLVRPRRILRVAYARTAGPAAVGARRPRPVPVDGGWPRPAMAGSVFFSSASMRRRFRRAAGLHPFPSHSRSPTHRHTAPPPLCSAPVYVLSSHR